jgi:hypothetical protein
MKISGFTKAMFGFLAAKTAVDVYNEINENREREPTMDDVKRMAAAAEANDLEAFGHALTAFRPNSTAQDIVSWYKRFQEKL